MFSRIRAVFTIIQFAITVLIVIILMYIFRKNNRIIRQKWAKLQRFLMGYSLKVKGKIDENVQLIVLNHQSLVDIVILEDLHPKNLCWVAKKEIENIPIFGHIIKAPYMISIQREDKKAMLGLFKSVKNRIKNQRVIAIFPEGTRSDGKRLLRFKKGSKFLAESLNMKIQPVVILGSRNVFDSQKMKANSGEIKVTFLPSFYPEKDTTWFEDLQNDMKKALELELSNDTSNR